MSRLFITNGTMAGHSIEIDKEITTLGRGDDNDVQINDSTISRNHLKVMKQNSSLYIEDLGSHNGTTINRKPLEPGVETEIKIGDLITMGNLKIEFLESKPDPNLDATHTIDLKSLKEGDEKNRFSVEKTISDSKRLYLLYDFSTLFMGTLNINEICNKIMDALFNYFEGIDDGAIILENKDTGEFEAINVRERNTGKPVKSNYSRTIVNKVIKERSAIMVSDTEKAKNDELSKSIEMMKVKSIMSVPLLCKSKILGAIYVQSTNKLLSFKKEDLHFFTGLSTPAALAIENALLYSELKEIEENRHKLNEELEERVRKRTHELSELNKNLKLAYSMIKKEKDRLSEHLQGNVRGFVLNKKGQVLGVTDEFLECSGIARIELIGKNIADLVDEESREKILKDVLNASKGISTSSVFNRLYEQCNKEGGFSARIMPLNTLKEKNILVLIKDE